MIENILPSYLGVIRVGGVGMVAGIFEGFSQNKNFILVVEAN